MFKILKLNNIAQEGLKVFNSDDFHYGDDVTNPDAIILRSHDMHEMDITRDLKAVGRAGSGVNNIPIDKYTEQAIPVFNAPGANSNAVKELVLASILIAARNIHSAIKYVESVKESDNLKGDIEHGKKAYVGFELPAKTLGVIGLGQIGVKVANAAHDLGMNVIGYDPLITVDNAINLQPGVQNVNDLKELLTESNIITIHIPHKKETENFIGDKEIKRLNDGSIIIISSIGGLKGSNLLGAYNISKAADIMMVKNIAAEFGRNNIRANSIAPGLIKTDFAKALWENPDILKAVLGNTPMQRIGQPDEIAGAAVMLSSKAGEYINGQTIVIDGGTTIA